MLKMFETRQGEIYRIWFINDPSNKSYVGQTINGARKRVRQHIDDAYDKNKGGCPLLDKATRKFGAENMRFEILANGIMTREELNEAERFWISQFNSKAPHGYNIQSGGYHAAGDEISSTNTISKIGAFDNPLLAHAMKRTINSTHFSKNTKRLISMFLGV